MTTTGLLSIPATNVHGIGVLTANDLRRAADAIRNAPPHPCSEGKHLLHPQALERPGIYRCSDCGAPVSITAAMLLDVVP